jgi:hypothetical protein
MVRMSKQGERRAKCPRKRQVRISSNCCGQVQKSAEGFKAHANAVDGDLAARVFIPKIK